MSDKFHIYYRRSIGDTWTHQLTYDDPNAANDKLVEWAGNENYAGHQFVICVNDERPEDIAAMDAEESELPTGQYRVDYHFDGEGWQFGETEYEDYADAVNAVDRELRSGQHVRPIRIADSVTGAVLYVRDDHNKLNVVECTQILDVLVRPAEEAEAPEDLFTEEEAIHIPSDEEVEEEFLYAVNDRVVILETGRTGKVIDREDNGYGLYYTIKMDDDGLNHEIVKENDMCLEEHAEWYTDEEMENHKGLLRRIGSGALGLTTNGSKGLGRAVLGGAKGLLSAGHSGLKVGFNITKVGVKYAAISLVVAGILSGGAYAAGEAMALASDHGDNPVVKSVVNAVEEASGWLDS